MSEQEKMPNNSGINSLLKRLSELLKNKEWFIMISVSFVVISAILFNTSDIQGTKPTFGHLASNTITPKSDANTPKQTQTSRYPWCDTDDIILPDGKQVWAACNVGASKASQYATCNDNKIVCPEEIAGKNFKWGNNNPYESGSTIESLTWANVWGAITNDPELMRGPCAEGYRVPSAQEIKSALSIRISEPFDPNAPWKPKDHEFRKDFQDYLKIPYRVWYTCISQIRWCELKPTSIWSSSYSYFWTRELSLVWDHHPVEFEHYFDKSNDSISLVNYRYQLEGDTRYYGAESDEDHTNTAKHAIPVRCIKDDTHSD